MLAGVLRQDARTVSGRVKRESVKMVVVNQTDAPTAKRGLPRGGK